MIIKTWLKQSAQRIKSDSPQLDAELLLADRLGKSRAYLLAFDDEWLPAKVLAQLEKDVAKLADGYPLAYLLGKKAFWDMQLCVSEATLIPRADTETLVELAEGLFPADTTATMIDLGTGSGAIAIALSRIFPHANITATDFSAEALAVAKQNAADWQVAPIVFKHCSWLVGFDAEQFDLIVSNPPYIVEGDAHLTDLSHEPISALTAPNQGLADIVTIISQAQVCLKHGGWLLIEHGYDQGRAVRELFDDSIWQAVKTHRDLGDNERVTMAQLR